MKRLLLRVMRLESLQGNTEEDRRRQVKETGRSEVYVHQATLYVVQLGVWEAFVEGGESV